MIYEMTIEKNLLTEPISHTIRIEDNSTFEQLYQDILEVLQEEAPKNHSFQIIRSNGKSSPASRFSRHLPLTKCLKIPLFTTKTLRIPRFSMKDSMKMAHPSRTTSRNPVTRQRTFPFRIFQMNTQSLSEKH